MMSDQGDNGTGEAAATEYVAGYLLRMRADGALELRPTGPSETSPELRTQRPPTLAEGVTMAAFLGAVSQARLTAQEILGEMARQRQAARIVRATGRGIGGGPQI